MFIEHKINKDTIDKILKIVSSCKEEYISPTCCTKKGFQTINIVDKFSSDILKKIVPINELHKKIFHMHYIKYKEGGYQEEHLHQPDEYSFILYLNDADGDTFLKEPVNKKITPEKGKVIVFDAKILHYAVPSYKQKQVLVGAING
jgi:hypothetical protein|tara:strand:+ start:52 stop:489 length:438 start_codon:yes stop_codon:yes gene_type:complete